MPRKKKEIRAASPCEGCSQAKSFSFRGCANECEKFRAHLVREFKQGIRISSPCKNFRCGVPSATTESRKNLTGICQYCPMRRGYSDRTGIGRKGAKCSLGKKNVTRYEQPWWVEKEWRKQH